MLQRGRQGGVTWQQALAGTGLLAMTLAAYTPALRGGFVWDDDAYVTGNPNLKDIAGLGRIWTDPKSSPQYYPLVFTTFWVERRLWGLEPFGYHLANVLLHGLSAVLLWRLLRRLEVRAAWVAAAVFALHPVNVESVAWITERKNTLSLALYLAAFLAYLRFRPAAGQEVGGGKRRWRWYVLSLALFVGALLSKTVTCTLPVAMLLAAWWKRRRLRLADLLPTRQSRFGDVALPLVPFILLGAGLGLATAWIEKHHVGAAGQDWSLSAAQRVLLAGRALWFYAEKVVLPARLTFIYPRWSLEAARWWQWLYPAAALAVAVALVALRRRLGRGPLAAAGFFVVTLAPALGFFDVYPMRYSFVADHFQYHAAIGLIVLLVSGGATGLDRLRLGPRRLGPIAVTLLLTVLAFLTWRQARIYRDAEALWLDTLAKNPACWMAHNNLGDLYNRRGWHLKAVAQLQESLRDKPDHAGAEYNLALALAKLERLDKAAEHYQRALALDPASASARNNLAVVLTRLGRTDEARGLFEEALRRQPDNIVFHYNLAVLLVAGDDRDGAIRHYAEVVRLQPDFADARFQLEKLKVLATTRTAP